MVAYIIMDRIFSFQVSSILYMNVLDSRCSVLTSVEHYIYIYIYIYHLWLWAIHHSTLSTFRKVNETRCERCIRMGTTAEPASLVTLLSALSIGSLLTWFEHDVPPRDWLPICFAHVVAWAPRLDCWSKRSQVDVSWDTVPSKVYVCYDFGPVSLYLS